MLRFQTFFIASKFFALYKGSLLLYSIWSIHPITRLASLVKLLMKMQNLELFTKSFFMISLTLSKLFLQFKLIHYFPYTTVIGTDSALLNSLVVFHVLREDIVFYVFPHTLILYLFNSLFQYFIAVPIIVFPSVEKFKPLFLL